jgi:pimeloyl-ACP methyl ester carboxylesterase
MQLALNARSRVRSLSLLCTFARGADAVHVTPKLLWILLRLRFGSRPVRRKAFMELVLSPGQKYSDAIAQRLAAVFGHDIADMPPITNQQVDAMRRHDVTSRLNELSGIPTLVINGEKDMIARPSSGRVIAAGIAGSRYIEIPGAAHAFPILEAERCAALLLEHLSAVESRRVAP